MDLSGAEPRNILLAAAAAIIVLMAMSEFQPAEVTSIDSVGEETAELTVIVQHCRTCNGGFLLNISDGVGGDAIAFCSSELLPTTLPSGTVADITVQRSSDDHDFFIASGLKVIDRK